MNLLDVILRQSVAARVPVRLLNSSGAGVAGMVPADITNGVTPTHVSVVKSDGTLTDITLSNGVNFFEIDATKAPGLYHILLPTGATAVPGTIQLVVMPAAAAFIATVITGQVESIALDAETARKIMVNRLVVDDVTKQMTVYEDDGVTPAFTFDLFDKDGVPTTINPYTREPV